MLVLKIFVLKNLVFSRGKCQTELGLGLRLRYKFQGHIFLGSQVGCPGVLSNGDNFGWHTISSFDML